MEETEEKEGDDKSATASGVDNPEEPAPSEVGATASLSTQQCSDQCGRLLCADGEQGGWWREPAVENLPPLWPANHDS